MEQNNNPTLDFYNDFIRIPFGNDVTYESLKVKYFSEQLQENTLYKYISFDTDDGLNEKKLTALENDQLWFAAPHVLRNNDPSEFQINANTCRVAKATGWTMQNVIKFLNTLREYNDLCCLSDRLHEFMWMNYANNHSGCCCVFEIKNTEMLMPVIYCDKKKTDFTQELIRFMKNPDIDGSALKTLAFVCPSLKDKEKYENEHEVRLLCADAYDSENGPLGGRIAEGKKEAIGYAGTYYSYAKCGLSLKKIIIGKNAPISIIERIKTFQLGVDIEIETY